MNFFASTTTSQFPEKKIASENIRARKVGYPCNRILGFLMNFGNPYRLRLEMEVKARSFWAPYVGNFALALKVEGTAKLFTPIFVGGKEG